MQIPSAAPPSAVTGTNGSSLSRVPPEQLMDEAMKMAATIAAKSPLATRMAKNAAQTIEFMTLRDGYRYEQNLTRELSRSEDAREAMTAFVEKRPPTFKGR